MNRLLIVILPLFIEFDVVAQQGNRVETIPLGKSIEIEILSIDSTSIDLYKVYEFRYQAENKEIQARFWAEKSDTNFNLGTAHLELCRIVQMKTENRISMRGCTFYNGLAIYEDGTKVRMFHFNEYDESPTLRLCSTN